MPFKKQRTRKGSSMEMSEGAGLRQRKRGVKVFSVSLRSDFCGLMSFKKNVSIITAILMPRVSSPVGAKKKKIYWRAQRLPSSISAHSEPAKEGRLFAPHAVTMYNSDCRLLALQSKQTVFSLVLLSIKKTKKTRLKLHQEQN